MRDILHRLRPVASRFNANTFHAASLLPQVRHGGIDSAVTNAGPRSGNLRMPSRERMRGEYLSTMAFIHPPNEFGALLPLFL